MIITQGLGSAFLITQGYGLESGSVVDTYGRCTITMAQVYTVEFATNSVDIAFSILDPETLEAT
jgi:hypothetical protein